MLPVLKHFHLLANQDIRDACNTVDIFNGYSSGLVVVTKWSSSGMDGMYLRVFTSEHTSAESTHGANTNQTSIAA